MQMEVFLNALCPGVEYGGEAELPLQTPLGIPGETLENPGDRAEEFIQE